MDKAKAGAADDAIARFERLFHEHWSRVYGALFRVVGDPAEAEDLALETFLRLYLRPPAKGNDSQLAGWLYRVATNLGFNAVRARRRRAFYELQAGREALEEKSTSNPAKESEMGHSRKQVRRVLAQMRPRAARLLILRHSGLSYAEVASALGVAPGSVGSLLARAEAEFMRRFRELEGE